MDRQLLTALLLLLVKLTFADESVDLSAELEGCRSSFNVSNDDVERITEKHPPTTPEAKCFLHCLFSKIGVMTEEGKMDAEGTKKFMRQIPKLEEPEIKKLEEVADKCSEAPLGEKPCENAVLVFNCINTEADERGLKAP